MCSRILIAVTLFCSLHVLVCGHGRLMDPPSRGSMWRMGFKTPKNYNDNQLYCGGFTYQWKKMNGKCGICGDPYGGRRDHEAGGMYANGIIVKTYKMGDVIEAKVDITANHKGYFQFKICPNNDPTRAVTQECLDQYPLMAVNEQSYMYNLPSQRNTMFKIKLKLPEGLTCTQCVFQWVYTSGNNWGICPNGKGRTGCGPQEQFRGCSDVAIVAQGSEQHPVVTRPQQPQQPYVPEQGGNHQQPEQPAGPYQPQGHGNHQQPEQPARPYQPQGLGNVGGHQHPSQPGPYKPQQPTYKRPATQKPSYPTYRPVIRYKPRPSVNRYPVPTQYPVKTYQNTYTVKPTNNHQQYKPNKPKYPNLEGRNTYRPVQPSKPRWPTKKSPGPKVCKAVGVWKSVPGMNVWCKNNCSRGYCPATHCKC